MRRECRERFPRHRLQRKPLVSYFGMHHGTCVTHVPWCMSGSLTRAGGANVPGIPSACATRNFTYLIRGLRKPHNWAPWYCCAILSLVASLMSLMLPWWPPARCSNVLIFAITFCYCFLLYSVGDKTYYYYYYYYYIVHGHLTMGPDFIKVARHVAQQP